MSHMTIIRYTYDHKCMRAHAVLMGMRSCGYIGISV